MNSTVKERGLTSVVSSDGKGRLGEEGGLGQRIGLCKGLLMRKNVALVPGVVVEDGTGEGDGPRGRHVCAMSGK